MLHGSKNDSPWLYLVPALTVVLCVGVLPIAFVFFYSLHDTFGGNVFIWSGAEWYRTVLTDPAFFAALLKSLLFALLALSIQIPLGVYLALRIPKTGVMVTFILVALAIPMLMPTIVVGYLWKAMIQPNYGLLYESLLGIGVVLDMNHPVWTWVLLLLMDTWHWTGLVVLLCFARLKSVPESTYQAAAIDGASRRAVFRHVQLPKMKVALTIAILLRFMESFTIYTEPYVITRGGPGVSTTFLSHELVQTGLIQFDLGKAGAMAVIFFSVVVVVSIILYRVLVIMPNESKPAIQRQVSA